MDDAVLVLDAGPSSLKFSVFTAGLDRMPALMIAGRIDHVGVAPHLVAKNAAGSVLIDRGYDEGGNVGWKFCLSRLMTALNEQLAQVRLIGAGHKIVHGGADLIAPVRIDDDVLERLEALIPLAPMEQPNNLAAIKAVAAHDPKLPQVACFDTAFHRTRPQVTDLFALPFEFYSQGIRRYGFHGIACEAIMHRLSLQDPVLGKGRIIIAHLGRNASLCAIQAGQTVDTSTAFTPLDGVPMGSFCGTIDPGVLLYLMEERHLTAYELTELLYHRSGLLGLSGISSDLRELMESEAPRAALAIDHFILRLKKEIGALAAVLGGLDALIFTAGIGEHAPVIRARLCQGLSWMGVRIDELANARNKPQISARESQVAVLIMPANKDAIIAAHTMAVIGPAGSAPPGVTGAIATT